MLIIHPEGESLVRNKRNGYLPGGRDRSEVISCNWYGCGRRGAAGHHLGWRRARWGRLLRLQFLRWNISGMTYNCMQSPHPTPPTPYAPPKKIGSLQAHGVRNKAGACLHITIHRVHNEAGACLHITLHKFYLMHATLQGRTHPYKMSNGPDAATWCGMHVYTSKESVEDLCVSTGTNHITPNHKD